MSIANANIRGSCPVQYLLVFLGIDEGAEYLEEPYFYLKSLEAV